MSPEVRRYGRFGDVAGMHKIPVISRAVSHNGVVYTSGVVGEPGGDVRAQTRQALERLEAILGDAGSSKSSILSAQVWLADMSDFAAHNEVWDSWIDPDNAPARACVQANLYIPAVLVEIRVIAAVVVAGPREQTA
jgi:enamine deaminase RidA (YjgF/YER057c/UK114 family)